MNEAAKLPNGSAATVELSESLEDYLEAILAIEGEKQAARPKDIARRLHVSPPSVTAALQHLAARKLVNYAPYDLVTLTVEGRRVAQDVERRHAALHRFFTHTLQLDPAEADEAACHMEHALPARALDRLVEFMDLADITPCGGPKWSEGKRFGLCCIDPTSGEVQLPKGQPRKPAK